MDDQGGAGGVPLHGKGGEGERAEEQRRKPRAKRPGTGREHGVRAADTDEASRLDRPQEPEDARKGRSEARGPDEY